MQPTEWLATLFTITLLSVHIQHSDAVTTARSFALCDLSFLAKINATQNPPIFTKYHSSVQELGWYSRSPLWDSSDEPDICELMKKEAKTFEEAERATIALMTGTPLAEIHVLYPSQFSQMTFITHLDRHHSVSVSYLIEPLAGILRDPFDFPCNAQLSAANPSSQDLVIGTTQQKRHYLLGPSAVKLINIDSQPPCITTEPLAFEPWLRGRILVFDLGATLFGKLGNVAGASAGAWFYEKLKLAGLSISHYWAFEATEISPKEVWESVPLDLRGHYTYINVPVSADHNSSDYPWRILEQAARPEDFVIIKVDIDTPQIENPLVLQLLSTPRYLELIDEFFYEHHVDVAPMRKYWGSPENLRISDSYRIFTQFRKAGVRSHSWP